MDDVLIAGGGVIGLAVARELAGAGRSVRVIDRAAAGQSSWAAAGILPPAAADPDDPLAPLVAQSRTRYADWAQELRDQTGIDPGYRRCGALHLARRDEERQTVEWLTTAYLRQGVECRRLTAREVSHLEPSLRIDDAGDGFTARFVPDEAQIRSPRLLRALAESCTRRGVTLQLDHVVRIERQAETIVAHMASGTSISAQRICVTSGAWSSLLAQSLGVTIPLTPIRGQMLLLQERVPTLQHIVNEGQRYLVPRGDGCVLVGSTLEDVGFAAETTADAIADLRAFAIEWCPHLANAEAIRSWSGLRPCPPDSRPYLGRVPGWENAFVATGHFRSGLTLAPVTAEVMCNVILGKDPGIDMRPFALERADQSRGAHRASASGGR